MNCNNNNITFTFVKLLKRPKKNFDKIIVCKREIVLYVRGIGGIDKDGWELESIKEMNMMD